MSGMRPSTGRELGNLRQRAALEQVLTWYVPLILDMRFSNLHTFLSLLMEDILLQAMRTAQSTCSATIQDGSCIRYLVRLKVYSHVERADVQLGLIKPVRAVKFSPGSKLLAGAGDSQIIALFDAASGEQVANLTGHGAWIFSLDWSFTGEYLLSG